MVNVTKKRYSIKLMNKPEIIEWLNSAKNYINEIIEIMELEQTEKIHMRKVEKCYMFILSIMKKCVSESPIKPIRIKIFQKVPKLKSE